MRLFSWTTVGGVSTVIVLLALIPIVPPDSLDVRFADKAVHGAQYGALAFLVRGTALRGGVFRARGWGFGYAFLLGAVIEIIQLFLPYRSFEIMDLVLNAAGAGAGMMIPQTRRSTR
ncbi:MAG: hypothetical protein GF333_06505 [Candidatus Omnitrophica bacterium]|nr:hypothetical protein [Candidatus Omnitrophota bacterium]